MKTRRTRSSKAPRATSLTLASECTAAEAGKLKTRLTPLLSRKSAVTVDVSAVRRVDTAGMQLLAAFVRERRTRGLPVAWRGSAPAITEAAQLLGLVSFFDQAVS